MSPRRIIFVNTKKEIGSTSLTFCWKLSTIYNFYYTLFLHKNLSSKYNRISDLCLIFHAIKIIEREDIKI